MLLRLLPVPRPVIALGWLALAAVLAVPGARSRASAQEGPAGQFLKSKHVALQRALKRKGGDGERRVDDLLGDLLDYRAMAETALASHWKDRSSPEREEFVDLLRQLVERSYRGNLESTLDYRVRYGSEEDRDALLTVHTTAQSRKNRRAPAIQIDYRLRQEGKRWWVVDVITDTVSMVTNYKRQFDRIIRRSGFADLLARMRRRLQDRRGAALTRPEADG